MSAAPVPSPDSPLRIFVTVGAQMPFDRLIRAVDAWASEHREHEIFAQIGDSAYEPRNIRWTRFLSPAEFDRAYESSDAIIGHAGIGTLFAALERHKPIVVMPRRAALSETRNDHQVATAKRFADLAKVQVAWDEQELPARLDLVRTARPEVSLATEARGPLIRKIAEFIDNGGDP
jgi:UDP-N-acetylglucosamine transferase subunit ALG13